MIERAKSNQSSCRGCHGGIAKGEPRWVELVDNKFDDDKFDHHYFHLRCIVGDRPFELARALERFAEPFPERAELEQLASLWEQVAEDLGDLDVRHVLADVLVARGDPRGEFMSGQLNGFDVDAALATHGHRWLGGAWGCVRTAEFRNGLLAAVELESNPSAGAILALRFVEDAASGGATSESYARLIRSMVRARRIEVYDDATLTAFEKSSAAIEHVGCGLDVLYRRRFLRACAKRPGKIRSLAIGLDGLLDVFSAKLPLEALTIVVDRLNDLRWDLVPRELEVRIARSARLYPPGELAITRLGRGYVVRASGEWWRDGLHRALVALLGSHVDIEQQPPRKGVWRATMAA